MNKTSISMKRFRLFQVHLNEIFTWQMKAESFILFWPWITAYLHCKTCGNKKHIYSLVLCRTASEGENKPCTTSRRKYFRYGAVTFGSSFLEGLTTDLWGPEKMREKMYKKKIWFLWTNLISICCFGVNEWHCVIRRWWYWLHGCNKQKKKPEIILVC